MWRKFSGLSKTAERFIQIEHELGCHNYHPLPIVLARGKGVHLYDVDGKQYLDFLAAYSAVNQGHSHPRIVSVIKEQVEILTCTSRAFHHNQMAPALEKFHTTFGYDKTLMMNSGCEAVESAVKFVRRWGYEKKGIPDGRARVLFCKGNFWGRSIAACGSSDDFDRYNQFGPYGDMRFDLIEFNNPAALEQATQDPDVCAFIFEPIQGENGVIVPQPGYLQKVREICTRNKVLMVADEIQTGLGRAGKLLAVDWEGVRPDVVTLGKSLSGGTMPISAVLCDDEVMLNIRPNQHGSTFGGNTLAARVVQEAIQICLDEDLPGNSARLGNILRQELQDIKGGLIQDVRGQGLMNAIEVSQADGAWSLCMKFAENGLLAKPTHGNIIRFTPPLVITESELAKGIDIIKKVVRSYQIQLVNGRQSCIIRSTFIQRRRTLCCQ